MATTFGSASNFAEPPPPDPMCTDPNCSQCKELKKQKEKAELINKLQLSCCRCTSPIKDTANFYPHCPSCNQLIGMELNEQKGRNQSLMTKISNMENAVEKANLKASSKEERLKSVEVAFSEESDRFLKTKANFMQAMVKADLWKAIAEHAESGCAYCKAGSCMKMISLKESVKRTEFEWNCEECAANAAKAGLLNANIDSGMAFFKHYDKCSECNKQCQEGKVLFREFYGGSMNIMRNDIGSFHASRLKESIRSLSVLGDGGSIVFSEGKYLVTRFDMKRMKVSDIKVDGAGSTPYEALMDALNKKAQVHEPVPSM